uniref:Uncharacterized protein n=1 Tax=Cannabis sativa TaxID=3483 RepID=A0A803Q251_CANSA
MMILQREIDSFDSQQNKPMDYRGNGIIGCQSKEKFGGLYKVKQCLVTISQEAERPVMTIGDESEGMRFVFKL